MGQSLLIRNAEMVFDGKVALGDLRSTAGVIEAIAPGGGLTPREGEVVIDGEGLHLLPGAIDPQVHFREPGQPEKEDIGSGSMAAAADVIVKESGIKDGYGLVVDCKDGQLPFELAMRTNLEICAVFDDEAAMLNARRMYAAAGLNVRRIATWLRRGDEKLPYPSFFADLVVSEAAVKGGALPKDTEDWTRLLKPILPPED